MTCLEDIAGITGANSLRNKYKNKRNLNRNSIILLYRYNKFDHNFMKKWLLREQPEEKHDLRLWQTFRNIDLQTAIKLHEEKSSTKQTTTSHSPKILAVVNHSTTAGRKPSIMSMMFVVFI